MALKKSNFSTTKSFGLEGYSPRHVTYNHEGSSHDHLVLKPIKLAEEVQHTKRTSLKVSLFSDTQPQNHGKIELQRQPTISHDTLRSILQIENRSDEEAFQIYDHIKNFKFFGQFLKEGSEDKNMDVFLYICKKLNYELHKAGTVIMHQGDSSDGKVYLVLSGELLVYVQGASPSPSPPVIQPSQTSQSPRIPFSRNESMADQPKKLDRQKSSSHKLEQKIDALTGILGIKHKKEPKWCNTTNPSFERTKTIVDSKHHQIESRKNSSTNFDETTNHKSYSKKEELSTSFGEKVESLQKISTKSIESTSKGLDSHKLDHQVTKNNEPEHVAASPKHLKKLENLEPAAQHPVYGLLVNKIQTGSYFGEKALYKRHKRNASIITRNEVELLTLKQEDFQRVQEEFNKARTVIKQFLMDIFPNVEDVYTQNLLESLLYNCEVKVFPYKKVVALEGETGDEFYVIFEGKCEFSKAVIYDESKKLDFPINDTKPLFALTRTKKEPIVLSNTERGTFIGEEILFNDKSYYEYTVKVSSDRARLISLKKSKFLFRCPKPVLSGLNDLYNSKKERNNQFFQEKLQKKTGNSIRTSPSPRNIEGTKSIITLNKEKIQVQNLVLQSYPNSPKNSRESPSHSPTFEGASPRANVFLLDRSVGCAAIRSYKIGTPQSKDASPKFNLFSAETSMIHTGNINLPQDNIHKEEPAKDNSFSPRPKTEPTRNSIHTFSLNPTPVSSIKGFNKVNSSVLKTQIYSPKDKVSTAAATQTDDLEFAKSFKGTSPRGNFFAKPVLIEGSNELDKLFENKNDKKNKRRIMSASWIDPKPIELHKRNSKNDSTAFLGFLKARKEDIMKKKQKHEKKFSQQSIEISYKASEPVTVISFGTPRIGTNTSQTFPVRHQKLIDRFSLDFEKHLTNIKTRAKKQNNEPKLGEALVVNEISQSARPKTSQITKAVDMNLQFYSGFN